MPRISYFYGISIYMYSNEHNPPHVHAVMGDKHASFTISDGELMSGSSFPPKGRQMVKEFILKYREELYEMWGTGVYKKLEPIE